jgi:hypothetical protein
MVDRARIQTYAQELANQHIFLQLVLYYVASRLQHEILNSDEADTLLGGVTSISQGQISHLQEQLSETLYEPEFLETCAANILEQLEVWQTSGKRPENMGSGGLATGFRKPGLSEEAASREAEVRDRYAADAADFLIAKQGLLQYDVAQLDELIGLKAERERVKAASSKLSQLQKKILLELLKQTTGYQRKPVPWVPREWFGDLTDSKRAAISHALKQLEARELVLRKASGQKGRALRTALIEFTDLGYRSAKRLQQTVNREKNIT